MPSQTGPRWWRQRCERHPLGYYALLAGTASRRLPAGRGPKAGRYVSGAIDLGLGVSAAVGGTKHR